MFKCGRYLYVIFLCHLALEKNLKALVAETIEELTPKTHDLLLLATKAEISLPKDFREFIGALNNASVVTRYPSDLENLVKAYNKEVANTYLNKTREIVAWLKQDSRLKKI